MTPTFGWTPTFFCIFSSLSVLLILLSCSSLSSSLSLPFLALLPGIPTGPLFSLFIYRISLSFSSLSSLSSLCFIPTKKTFIHRPTKQPHNQFTLSLTRLINLIHQSATVLSVCQSGCSHPACIPPPVDTFRCCSNSCVVLLHTDFFFFSSLFPLQPLPPLAFHCSHAGNQERLPHLSCLKVAYTPPSPFAPKHTLDPSHFR